jgi:sRNA-binding regulator protein Hfq
MAETIKDGDIKKYKKWMIAVIDIYACQHKQMWRDETMLEVITKNEMSSKYACFMARAMYTFIICHEVAHIIYKHTKETSIRDELDADALGYEIFCALILDSENLTTLEFFEGLRRAPLALFDIFELVEYYKETIHNKTPLPSGHPLASLRKAALLNQFDFGNNVESFDLYLVISEKASALKHYIYEHRVGMREEVQRIHNDNFKC